MTIGSLAPGAVSFLQSTDRMISQRRSINDLQQQLATGRKSENFSGLGIDRRISLDARSKISAMEGFRAGIVDGRQRVKLMTTALTQLDDTVSQTRGELRTQPFQPSPDGKLRVQESARQNLSLAIDLLNTDHNGRYLFSGLAQDTRPVESAKFLIDGGNGFPGLRALAQERAEAELGGGDPPNGRLTIERDARKVSLESADGDFGFTIKGAAHAPDDRITITADAATRTTTFEVDENNLKDGDRVTIRLGDRFNDGYEYKIELIARTNPSGPGEFKIADTSEDTAEAMQGAMSAAIENQAQGVLAPRSQAYAIERYFANPAEFPRPDDNDPSQATDVKLASWYNGDTQSGDDDTPEALAARATASLRIDDNQVVGIGARANEAPFRDALVAFSQLEILRFDDTPEGKEAFQHISDRNADRLNSAPGSGLQAIGHQIASAEVAMRDADERHKVGANMLMDMVDGVEEVSKEEIAAKLLATQNRLEASYQTTAMLSQLTLLNYL